MKNTGTEIDKVLHQELLSSFVFFIENFAPVIDKAEEYQLHITGENLIDQNEDNKNKLEVVNEMNELLTSLVPVFIKFAQLEAKLENFYK